MVRDELIRRSLEGTNWELVACSMPSNVLLLTGYWPAAGYSVAAATREGQIALVVPEDEDDVAGQSWADEIVTYCPAPLDRLTSAEEPVFEAFAALKTRLRMLADRIGFEQAEVYEPAAFAPNMARGSAARILRRAFPGATFAPADELLAEMRTIKTPAEIAYIRTACKIAEEAFAKGARVLRPGITEVEAAAAFRIGLASCLGQHQGVTRCDGFTVCMSGPNSGHASGTYGRSRTRPLSEGDLVVVRCQCYADGYWADIARTYHLGPVDPVKKRMFEAILEARQAVLDGLQPGVKAGELDEIARRTIEAHGFGAFIRHPTGHGAGFGALEHTARPRLHPKSSDVIEEGMVLKLEPGIYIEGRGGVRNADMVAVTASGYDLLTNVHWGFDELAVQAE